jgi:catechol 2,3-dioxygenase-like lactoylglutathione lyase family enzyme
LSSTLRLPEHPLHRLGIRARHGQARRLVRAKSVDWSPSRRQGDGMDLRIQCLCIDTTDPARVATFWREALGWRRTHERDDEVVLEPPAGGPEDGIVPDLLFLRVPEEKQAKNRLHLDLRPLDQAAEVVRLEGLGARRVDVGQREDVSWVVMADPDGNEFCVLRPLTPEQLAAP